MSPFVPRKPTLLRVLNGMEDNNAAEKLDEQHGIKISKETLRQWMIEWGLWKAKHQKDTQRHPQRAGRDCLGELVQIGGSPHDGI